MFLSSNFSPMTNNEATTFPDLSLQISPPFAADEYNMTGCIIKRPPSTSSSSSDLSQENTFNHHHYQQLIAADMDGFVNHGLQFDQQQPQLTLGPEMGALNDCHPNHHYHPRGPRQIYSYDFKRSSRMVNSVRRGARAPRMRWTSSLHAHFIHAVQLLGGHERATPKSVQELMNVKDLTLAHVKSHLQMYRTVKSTDRGGAVALTDTQVINPRAPISLFEVEGDISPSTTLHISQRRSFESSLETNDLSYTMKKNVSSDYPISIHTSEADDEHEVTLSLSKKIKMLENNRTYSSSERLLNLEFTLGRPCRQLDQIF
ncbi:probable transcription factor KAN4 isoform X1 [Lactuca sativa]|uniref:probable transcription factor KAN4 isoform X1 n=1 Tax=Lactuca sativa TaxID=4236 RepID=UPI000CC4EDDB|nr:probable transcription factor KAN4 isoform X1 [Lactuca sativa]